MESCCICQSVKMMNPDEFIHSRIRKIMEKKKCCFTCAFWFEKLKLWKNDRNWLVVDGQSYHVNPILSKPTVFQGFGGHWFFFKKNDGTLIKSNNVWCQGKIPEHFKKLIPNNAVMVTEKEYNLLNKIKRMKRAKLYIPVMYNDTNKYSLLNADKLSSLKEILPFEETLKTFMRLQHAKIKMNEDYKPKPFEIQLEKEKFIDIIFEVKRKISKHGTIPIDHVALFSQYPGLPICIIKMKEE